MTKPRATAAQTFVPVKEIRNGVIILKDGGYRGVLICSSVNFGLKSAGEQAAIISGFQTFLNTLDFPVEIVVQSRKMDIRPYLSLLAEKEKDQQTELLRIQLREYMAFVRSFTENSNIMTKSFYVLVPYAPEGAAAAKKALGGLIHMGGSTAGNARAQTKSFEESHAQLEQRMALVASSLSATGVRAVPLGTEEIIELLYRSFNPGELENPIRLEQ
ncbi:MAG: hypothetical protein B7X04_02675 [Parcubacteria group bacterium 21-54-25]|nr:MAG: hypothetical protein B7X04_02675 [Parcubacteria group bacterium 21-54-25]HQU07743.1 hypothetical protein [Candidatus Paceibacterota bacterium]